MREQTNKDHISPLVTQILHSCTMKVKLYFFSTQDTKQKKMNHAKKKFSCWNLTTDYYQKVTRRIIFFQLSKKRKKEHQIFLCVGRYYKKAPTENIFVDTKKKVFRIEPCSYDKQASIWHVHNWHEKYFSSDYYALMVVVYTKLFLFDKYSVIKKMKKASREKTSSFSSSSPESPNVSKVQ